MSKKLLNIIKNKQIVNRQQKIMNIQRNSVVGYESLNRGPKNSIYSNPLVLINDAKANGLLWEFEKVARYRTFQNISHIRKGQKIFINVEPDLVKSPDFSTGYTMDLVKKAGFKSKDIVFEITERAAISDFDKFIKIINHYRKQNYLIAVDDVGTGYSGMSKIIRLEPDIIKLDIELIKNIHKNKYKKAIVKGFKTISDELDIMVIAEGIEKKEELETLRKIGIKHGQGYYLHRPQRFNDL
ncbi:MAG: EAL domain-containing protein, partial [Bacillota bacterium]